MFCNGIMFMETDGQAQFKTQADSFMSFMNAIRYGFVKNKIGSFKWKFNLTEINCILTLHLVS